MSWPRLNRIRARLLGLLSATIGSLVLVVIGLWEFNIEPALRLNVAKNQREVAIRAADLIAEFIDEKILDLTAAVQIGRLWQDSNEHRTESLYQLLKVVPSIRELSLVDANGNETVRVSRTRTYTGADLRSLASADQFRLPMRGEVYIGSVYHEQTAEPFITVAVPNKSSTVDIKGVLTAEINLKTLWNVVSHLKVGHNGYLYVVDGTGQLIAHYDFAKVILGTNLAHVPEVREFLRNPRHDIEFGDVESGMSGEPVITSFALVRKPHWGVVVEESIDTAFEDSHRLTLLAGFILGLAVLSMVAVSYRFTRRLTEPIAQLEKGAARIAEGELDYQLDIRTGDEIEQLANKFNRMAAALKESHSGLEAKIAERTDDISSLYAALAPLKPADSLAQILDNVLTRLCEATGADAARVRLWDQNQRVYVSPAAKGFDATAVGAIEPPDHLPAADRVFKSGKAAIISNLATDARVTRGKSLALGFRSAAFLPLTVGGKTIGVVQLASRTEGFFKSDKKAHLMAIARQMGIAMENRELFAETQSNLKRIRALHQIDIAITSSLNLDEVLRVLLEQIDLFLSFSTVSSITLLHQKTGQFDPTVCRNVDEGEWKNAARKSGSQLAKLVYDAEQFVAIDEIQSDERVRAPKFFVQHGLHSYLGVSLKGTQGVLGVLGLYTTEPHRFSDGEIEFMITLGSQAAVAIQNSQLFEETKMRESQLRESNRYLAALHSIADAVSKSLDLDRVLKVAIENITEVFHFDATRIHVLRDESDELVLSAEFTHDPAQFTRARSFKRGQGIVGRVAESGEPIIFENIQTDPRYRELSHSKTSGQYHYRFFAVFPIKSKFRTVATLGCISLKPRKLSEVETQLLKAMTDQIGVATENSGLYADLGKKVRQLEEQTEQLQKAGKVKDEFLNVMSHELRTPLSVITGYANLLAEESFGTNNPEQAKGIRVIKDRSEALSGLVSTILEAVQLASGSAAVTMERVNLASLLLAVKDTYALKAKDSVTLNWEFSPTLPDIMIDAGKLRQILNNLIDNALKFTERGAVTISARLTDECEASPVKSDSLSTRNTINEIRDTPSEIRKTRYLEFTVQDTGIGITSDAVRSIFEKFRQADNSETRSYEGAGLGLFIVKKFTELLGGEVHVESEPGHGSTFTVTLPCEPCHATGQNGVDATAIDAWNGLPTVSPMLERQLI